MHLRPLLLFLSILSLGTAKQCCILSTPIDDTIPNSEANFYDLGRAVCLDLTDNTQTLDDVGLGLASPKHTRWYLTDGPKEVWTGICVGTILPQFGTPDVVLGVGYNCKEHYDKDAGQAGSCHDD